ncbi:hypothetical protein K438DRAFT_2104286 [Mycena galopus ATCC 62051]|nr:hypothetical protein K438DRAFT_2104286 [Mycena galopus ATCC 62051]
MANGLEMRANDGATTVVTGIPRRKRHASDRRWCGEAWMEREGKGRGVWSGRKDGGRESHLRLQRPPPASEQGVGTVLGMRDRERRGVRTGGETNRARRLHGGLSRLCGVDRAGNDLKFGPALAEHLSLFGLDVKTVQKTDKSMADIQAEMALDSDPRLEYLGPRSTCRSRLYNTNVVRNRGHAPHWTFSGTTVEVFPWHPHPMHGVLLPERWRGAQPGTKEAPALLLQASSANPGFGVTALVLACTSCTFWAIIRQYSRGMEAVYTLSHTNHLKHAGLRRVDVAHLSRSTVTGILADVGKQLRNVSVQDEELPVCAGQHDVLTLLGVLQEMFGVPEEMRVLLTEVVLDPGSAAHGREGRVGLDGTDVEFICGVAGAEGGRGAGAHGGDESPGGAKAAATVCAEAGAGGVSNDGEHRVSCTLLHHELSESSIHSMFAGQAPEKDLPLQTPLLRVTWLERGSVLQGFRSDLNTDSSAEGKGGPRGGSVSGFELETSLPAAAASPIAVVAWRRSSRTSSHRTTQCTHCWWTRMRNDDEGKKKTTNHGRLAHCRGFESELLARGLATSTSSSSGQRE